MSDSAVTGSPSSSTATRRESSSLRCARSRPRSVAIRATGRACCSIRSSQPVEPRGVNISGRSLGFVVQGSMAVIVDGERHVSAPVHRIVLTGRLLLQTTVLDASPHRAVLKELILTMPL